MTAPEGCIDVEALAREIYVLERILESRPCTVELDFISWKRLFWSVEFAISRGDNITFRTDMVKRLIFIHGVAFKPEEG